MESLIFPAFKYILYSTILYSEMEVFAYRNEIV